MSDKIVFMHGLLPIYKPSGITSYDVIRQVKKIIPRGTKIGHAGTLDPFAKGVLILMLGRATKRFDEIQTWRKRYRSVARLGVKSDTLDCDGTMSEQVDGEWEKVGKQEIQEVASKYLGQIEQVVPSYAAAKHKGRKLYEYAREGVEVPEKKKLVIVYSVEIVGVGKDEVEMLVECSSGTYIRQLSADILQELGIDSHLTSLVREAIGEIELEQSVKLRQVVDEGMIEKSLVHAHDE